MSAPILIFESLYAEIERLKAAAQMDLEHIRLDTQQLVEKDAEIERLRSILRRILKHIEDGTLVRDLSKDAEAGWMLPMMRLVVDLKDATEVVRAREAAR